MNQNPYAPPRANVELPPLAPTADAPALHEKLYDQKQVAVATFLGATLATGWLFASNYKALGDEKSARMSWIWGIVATIATVVVAYFLPEKVPNIALPLAVTLGARAFADMRFGKILESHQAAGGELASWWKVVGISLVCLAVVVAAVFGVVMLLFTFGVIEL